MARAIELNCDALLRIAAYLVAILRLPAGGMKDSLPAAIYFRVLRILRPAESAVRRLIVLETIGLDDGPGIPREAPDNGTTRTKTQSGSRSKPTADPAFQLFDPFKPLPDNPWVTEGEEHEDKSDALPGSEVFRLDEPRDAKSLGRRVRALIDALDDLPAQARRLARWRRTRRRPRRLSSLRPGFPPGYRRGRPVHEVDSILRECHGLVRWANKPPGQR